jgi:hypothetical protein
MSGMFANCHRTRDICAALGYKSELDWKYQEMVYAYHDLINSRSRIPNIATLGGPILHERPMHTTLIMKFRPFPATRHASGQLIYSESRITIELSTNQVTIELSEHCILATKPSAMCAPAQLSLSVCANHLKRRPLPVTRHANGQSICSDSRTIIELSIKHQVIELSYALAQLSLSAYANHSLWYCHHI